MNDHITLRPIRDGDEEFLYRVYASTREPELALVDWSVAQRTAFLQMQFAAQHQYYQEYYPGAVFQLILADDQPIGRLYLVRWPTEIRIIDIALLPTHRNAGIGTALLKQVLAEAEAAEKPVTIHVEQFNPALRLYTRLGFTPIADRGVYLLMQWSPPQAR